jgi:hypothetical protein
MCALCVIIAIQLLGFGLIGLLTLIGRVSVAGNSYFLVVNMFMALYEQVQSL